MALFATGCCALGERSMYISGTAPKTNDCFLSYHGAARTTEYRKEAISGEFRSSIMMGGCGGEFMVSAICNGKIIKTVKVTSKDEASYEKPFKLGEISP